MPMYFSAMVKVYSVKKLWIVNYRKKMMVECQSFMYCMGVSTSNSGEVNNKQNIYGTSMYVVKIMK